MGTKKEPYISKTLSAFRLLTREVDNNSKGCRLFIPQYQRYYAWTVEEVKDLLRDIEEAISAKEEGFFLGPILLLSSSNEDTDYSIIDGQQRILTISIIISYLMHKIFEERDGSNSQLIIRSKRFLWYTEESYDASKIDLSEVAPDQPDQPIPRIKFSLRENDTSYQLIICRNEKGQNGPFRKAFNAIEEYFIDNKKTIEYQEKYLKYLMDKVSFVVIETQEGRSINKIFETLNDRGLPLSQLELFKNFVLSYFPGDRKKDEIFKTCYLKLREDVNRLERYFLIYNQVLYGYAKDNKPGTWYRFWKSKILDMDEPEIFLSKTLNSLEKALPAYQALAPDDPYWDNKRFNDPANKRKVQQKLSFLKQYIISRPLLFSIIKNYEKKRASISPISEKSLVESIDVLYVFLARIWLVHGLSRIARIEQTFIKVAHVLENNEIELKPQSILNAIIEISAGDKYSQLIEDTVFRAKISDITYDSKKHNQAKFIFSVITRQHNKISGEEGDVSIEHVLPNSEEYLKNWENFDKWQHLNYKDRLGNMTLLKPSDNREANGKPFEEKKKIYGRSDFPLAKELTKLTKWGEKEITKQQKSYAGRLTDILSFSKYQ